MKIYIGVTIGKIEAATTKKGLARVIGCSVDTIRRNLVRESGISGDTWIGVVRGVVSNDGTRVRSWDIAEVELGRVERKGGKGGGSEGGPKIGLI
jgi:hypothetical protein